MVAGIGTTIIVTAMSTGVVRAEGEPDPPPDNTPAPTVTVAVESVVVAPPAEDPPAPATTSPQVDPQPVDTTPATTPTTQPAPASTEDTTPATTVPADTAVSDDTTPVPAATAGPSAPAVTPTTNAQHTADQQTVVTGTQVAAGNTGGNVEVNDPNPPAAQQPGGAIDTGGATAVGSADQNEVTQDAQVILTDQAKANLLQVALILNIGAALANSGSNGITSGPGDGSSGAIGTGNATAIGNDISQYLTQAANTNADSATDDSANQLAVSLFLGLALANSGVNTILGTGVAGSGGSIGTGGANAIGNQSLTDIEQQALLIGHDQSELDVTQRATVLNLGFALANSGLNDITGVAGSLLNADPTDDDEVAQQLFAMLLPALLTSYGYGPQAGAGSIDTGTANAIGNQSETFVKQVAGAAASGDGITAIVQDVLVANMGAAFANTGYNTLGSPNVKFLDAKTAEAVVQLAAFMAKLLSIVHSSTSDTLDTMSSQGMEIPFGNIILQVEGRLMGADTSLHQGDAQANIRQITIVFSLGIAQANSGNNVAATMSTLDAAQGVNDPTVANRIGTGNADAANHNLVIICQRINAANVACLAPPEPETPPADNPPAVTPTVGADSGETPTVADVPDLPQTTLDPPVLGFVRPEVGLASSTTGSRTTDTPRSTSSSPLAISGSDGIEVTLITATGIVAAGVALLGGTKRRRRT